MGDRRIFFQGRENCEPRPEEPRQGEVLREGDASPLNIIWRAQIDFCTIFDL